MREPARLQAAIELADLVIQSAQGGGAAADTIAQRYFAARRYAGSKDRAAVRALLFDAIRFAGEPPRTGRELLLGLARHARPDLLPLFDGSPHAPAPPAPDEPASAPSLAPRWLTPSLQRHFGNDLDRELEALLARAPFDIRVNKLKASREEVAQEIGGTMIDGLPYALRLPGSAALDQHPLFLAGHFEVQDAGSQRAILEAAATPGEIVIDLCAGAGGKTLGLAADLYAQPHPASRLVATDVDRNRLSAMTPRLLRTGLSDKVETRLLNPGQEAEALADLAQTADLVMIDAPCSGTGTWRRNPELRWRITPQRLRKLTDIQARLIDLGTSLLKPDGRIIYIVCSVLPEEGVDQVEAAARRTGLEPGRIVQLSPFSNGCDGFAIASLHRRC